MDPEDKSFENPGYEAGGRPVAIGMLAGTSAPDGTNKVRKQHQCFLLLCGHCCIFILNMIYLLPQEHINQLYSKEEQTMDEPTKSRDKHANENKVCHMLTNHIFNFTWCSRHMWLVMFLDKI